MPQRRCTFATLAALALAPTVLPSCGTGADSATPDTGDGLAVDAPGPAPDAPEGCSSEDPWGSFRIYHANGRLFFDGAHEDGPPLRPGGDAQREGACAFVRPGAPFCDPACAADELCDTDGVCRHYPVRVPAGTVTIRANGATVTATDQGQSFYTAGPLDGFASSGDPVTVEVSGAGALLPYHLTVPLVAALRFDPAITAREHQDLIVPWEHDVSPVGTRVTLHFDNDHHGVAAFIECEADDGADAITIPAGLLDQLIAAGETGIGTYIENAWIVRRLASVAPTSLGCAAFTAESPHFVTVETIRAP